jgi:Copper amine oxidase, enzyme domain
MSNVIEEANWRFHWRLTESAGVAVYLADYRGRRVLWEASLPYVTVDHQRQTLEVEGELAMETHGPWWAPLGQRTIDGPVRVQSFRGGVELSAMFSAGPYSYLQLWRFHDDGRICPWLTVYGPGVHDQHTYHPHWRFDFDLDGARDDVFERFEDGAWIRVDREGWFPYSGEADEHGYVWRQIDQRSGAAVHIRPHSWDDAEMFAIRYHDGEWAPFSPRSSAGSQPFPAAYMGEEALEGDDVTLWYVAHVHFDQSFPYTAGPWIRVAGF